MVKAREDLFTMPNEDGEVESEVRITEDGEVETDGRTKRNKIYIPLNPDGTIFEARFKDREAFETLVKGLPSSEGKPLFSADRDSIPILYDGIAMILGQVGKMFMGWPKDFIPYVKYSEEQKERLKEPTAKVIEKYAPEWLLKHQEIIALSMCFGQCTKEMVEGAALNYGRMKQAEAQGAVA